MSYFPTLRRPRILLDTPLVTPNSAHGLVTPTPPPSYHTMSPATLAPTPAPLFSRPAQPVPSALTQQPAPPNTQPRVGRSAFLDYPRGHVGPSPMDSLEAFLRQADVGPYPVMPHVNSQPNRPQPARSDITQASEQTVVERRGGHRMRINLGGLNRLPTISSHASQEGTEVARSTRASTRVSTRSRSTRVDGINNDAAPTQSLAAEIARTNSHSSRPMQDVDRNVASTNRSNSCHATGRLHRGKSSRQSRTEACPCRPPTPPPKDEPSTVESQPVVPHGDRVVRTEEPTDPAPTATRRAKRESRRSRPKPSKIEIDKNDETARWILYDEEGNVKRIWKLEYSSLDVKPHEVPRKPKKERKAGNQEAAPRGQVATAPRAEIIARAPRSSRYQIEREQMETSASRAREAAEVIEMGAMLREQERIAESVPQVSRGRGARSIVSEATHISQVTTSDSVAYSHGIFEAQERIEALEEELDSVREELREQATRMYHLPNHRMEAALQERVELKGVLALVKEEIEGWKEVIEVLQRHLRGE